MLELYIGQLRQIMVTASLGDVRYAYRTCVMFTAL